MLSYNKLKDRPRDFLAATGLTLAEFQKLLPVFRAAYDKQYPYELTRTGTPRQRRVGGVGKGMLSNCSTRREPARHVPSRSGRRASDGAGRDRASLAISRRRPVPQGAVQRQEADTYR